MAEERMTEEDVNWLTKMIRPEARNFAADRAYFARILATYHALAEQTKERDKWLAENDRLNKACFAVGEMLSDAEALLAEQTKEVERLRGELATGSGVASDLPASSDTSARAKAVGDDGACLSTTGLDTRRTAVPSATPTVREDAGVPEVSEELITSLRDGSRMLGRWLTVDEMDEARAACEYVASLRRALPETGGSNG